ncbi:MAG: secretin N-terminal domain-containing protein [Simkaniaceae bacterium]|nr:secretin N-terminal domain-containing protein [Candidatus Sacchlamyda saccharinae]
MKFWCLLFTVFFSFSPMGQAADDDALQEFDDDAFLSAKTEPGSDGLIGWSLFSSDEGEDRYTINFNNVSVIEYLRFISRIANVNFQFEEAELDFTITVVSEEPLTVQNILSALIQTLRARGFSLLEQDSNLLITRSPDVNQIPTIVTPDHNRDNEQNAPIVTRVFRIKNANLNSLASIMRPMMSKGAMIDVSNETRQLIVTDITTNVDKIATLLHSLDSPHSPLEIDIYKVHHMPAGQLGDMAKALLEPFAEENPLILVAQNESNSIYIVSTPSLIERAVEVLEDLDVRPRDVKGPMGNKVYLYKIQNKSASDLLEALEEIADELDGTGSQSVSLIAALENVKYIKESDSLMFITDTETQTKVETILGTLDTFSESRNFYIYKIQKAGKEQVEKSLEQLARSLKKGDSDRDLIDAIQSMRYIKETNSYIFTGTDESLKKLREILPTFDVAVAEYSPSSHYVLYTPKYLSGKELENAIEDLEDNLASSGLTDEALLTAIESMKWVPATNTLLFTGSPAALEHIANIIKLIDVPAGAPSKIFLYKPQYIDNEQIEEALDELADKLDHKNLSDRNLAAAIDDMTWISESQAFLFKADPGTIEKIELFLKDIDNPREAEAIASSYFLYKLKFARGDDVIDHLEKIAKNLPERDPSQKAIIEVIDNASFLRDTNAVLLTGPVKAVEDVKLLVEQFDVPGATPPSFDKTSFFIYKAKHLTPGQLEEALQETARDLKKSGLLDPSLLQSIDTMRVVEMTNSLIFTGTKESLDKTKEIIDTIDVKGAIDEEGTSEYSGHSFYIYKVRYVSMTELMKLIKNVVHNLEKEGGDKNSQLIKALKMAKEVKETHSILFTGPPPVLEKIAELMKQLDAPGGLGEADEGREAGDYVIYKPANVSGPELIDMMCDFMQNLQRSGVRDPSLFETIKNLQFIQRTSYILISGDPSSVEKAQELLRKFDVPGSGAVTSLTQLETSFLIYKLHYHQGKELQETLKKIGTDLSQTDPETGSRLMKAINSIQWIKMTNSLLATGTPDVLTQLKELIQNIDIPLRQVFIEVLIIQTTLNNNQQFGLQWGGKAQYLNRFAASTSNFPSPNPDGGANRTLSTPLNDVNATRTPLATDIPAPSIDAGGFDLGVIGDIILHRGKTFISLASLVNALQQDNDAVVVMNPKIVAQDNQQSTIFVGQNIPFTGSTVTTNAAISQQISTNLEYRDVGTSLSITPILGTNDMVTLEISNEITAQVANTTEGANIQGLQTSRTSLNTRVHVPDKHFVALSGMLQDNRTHFKSSIPCLGGLPVIGAIFSENDRLSARDNVIFFIRPVIIDSVEQYDEITDTQEALYKDLGSKQVVKEEIDDALEWVREPECYY